ncbi:hypothetical protein CYMTET_12110 [Cymbomonas tetramitiformis]|uniref:CULT domain-containing protein n=1 Tax=Cymbomonas tetramitiformis TaxID=36881 RepID=A0AAE0GKQ8_9CHLO|nr:hypothetical protein CYMTET_12110 [Cymbomonas tetramitiformis]
MPGYKANSGLLSPQFPISGLNDRGSCKVLIWRCPARLNAPFRNAPAALQQRRRLLTKATLDPMDDPDMQKRVNDNKRWKRDMDQSEAWDIDKELDSVQYKREAMEAAFRVAYTPEDQQDTPVVSRSKGQLQCRACGATVADAKHKMKKAKQHEHARMTPIGSLCVFRIFSAADGAAVVSKMKEQAWLFPPRGASDVECSKCTTSVGFLVADDPSESVGQFFALRKDALVDRIDVEEQA